MKNLLGCLHVEIGGIFHELISSTAKEISSIVHVKYLKLSIKLLNKVRSISLGSFLDSVVIYFIRVLVGLQSNMLNLLSISYVYTF